MSCSRCLEEISVSACANRPFGKIVPQASEHRADILFTSGPDLLRISIVILRSSIEHHVGSEEPSEPLSIESLGFLPRSLRGFYTVNRHRTRLRH